MSRKIFWIGAPLVGLGVCAFSATSAWARGGGGGGGGGGGSKGGTGGAMSGSHSSGPSFSPSIHSGSPNVGSGNFSSRNFSGNNFNSNAHNFSLSQQHFGNSNFQQGSQNFSHNVNSFHNAQNWAHNSNWNHGNWGWNNWHNNGFFWWGGGPFWWPAWWWGGYPGGYGYSDYYAYDTGYADVAQYAPAAPQIDQSVAASDVPNADAGNADAGNADAGAEFFAQAVGAFNNGQFKDSLRLANHAAVEAPQNPKAHELMSLSLFALGEYRPAAMEAHAALALGPPADWNELYSYYGDEGKYTAQLRDLEKASKDNPASAEDHFLRAYQYLMMGHTDAFKEQMADAVKLAPKDKLAAELLKKYGGGATSDAPLPPPPSPPGAAVPGNSGSGNVGTSGVDS